MATVATPQPAQLERALTPINGPFRRNLNTIFIIWYREVLRFVRDWIRIITSLAQPLMFLFIFGSGLSNSLNVMGGQTNLPPGTPTLDFRTFLFPGVLSMTVLFTSIFSAISIVWDREFGFLREMLVAPISRTSLVLGKAFGGSTIAMLQGTIMLIFAPLVGVNLSVGLVVKLMLEMLLLAFSLTSLGIVIASRMKSMEGFQMIMQFFLMPMFFLSGALFPLRNLPDWLAFLTKINPVTYGVDPLRQAVLRALNLPQFVLDALGLGVKIFDTTLSTSVELAIVAVLGLIFIVWGALAFNKQD
ncbi:ABC transporter permease [Thermogemmatispora sp.]|uniref:ABC transporter permease n=1 Tax=Thermogemmatispora sp. TaxID=1968838 RepID=UPI001DC4D4F7|nr:ABC transporter permease [Thermogemmatispora sp.]MBX5451668.1 ABC transporter permease [Thermogemmatispora sp.]